MDPTSSQSRPTSTGSTYTYTNDTDENTIRDSSTSPKKLEEGSEKRQTQDTGAHRVKTEDQNITIVRWDGVDDPCNPRNWSKKKKWASTIVVSLYTFITPVASSMMSPAATDIGKEFGVTNEVILSMSVSIFILAYAFGPLILGPLSEIFGRARVLQIANLFFLAFNLACGFAHNIGEFLAFRLLAGFGGSAPLAIGGAVIGDLFDAEHRGEAVAIYSLAPLLGPAVGPIAGAWIAQESNWRWVFWSTSIVCGAIQINGFIFLRETFEPALLEQRARKKRIEMGLDPNDKTQVQTEYDGADRHWQKIVGKALTRPFIMFYYEPIMQLLGIFNAFIYGLIYLFLVTIPDIFENTYHERVGIAGLNYIALGIGMTGASQINARLLDKIYARLKHKNGGEGKPEFRLPPMFVGVLCIPIGLLIFGWTAQNHVFWLVPDIGIMFLGIGMILIFQSIQTYIIDAFTLYAASALATVAFLRSLAGFGFPLFAPAMYKALGYGKGDTILAAFAIALGCPAPFIFWFYGERIRKRSKHAKTP